MLVKVKHKRHLHIDLRKSMLTIPRGKIADRKDKKKRPLQVADAYELS